MDNFRFRNWKVYLEAKLLFRDILEVYRLLPQEIKFSIGNQLIRSALSIILNIAEGSGKKSDKELNRFFDISMGSIYETYANIDVLADNKYINKILFNKISDKLENIKNQLGGFKKKLNSC